MTSYAIGSTAGNTHRDSASARGPVSSVHRLLPDTLPDNPQEVSWFVPGRIEVLGKHTDYAGGRSLLAAVNNGVTVTAKKRDDDRVIVSSTIANETLELPLSEEQKIPRYTWGTYPATVISRLVSNFGWDVCGADIHIDSTLPAASGMSSSSALVIGLARCLIDLGGIDRTPLFRRHIDDAEAFAAYMACIENGMSFGELSGHRGVGTFGGSEDHTAIMCSDEDSLVQYSFCPITRERTVPLPAGHVFVVFVSGIFAEKGVSARDKYNRVSLGARMIVQLWNEDTGRTDTYLDDVIKVREGVVERLRDIVSSSNYLGGRLDQFVTESEVIIPAAGNALLDGDLQKFGTLVDKSQHMAETGLQNQVPQTVTLHRQARELGAVAASAFGAGFGGSVWALVPEPEAPAFADAWREAYLREYPELQPLIKTIIASPSGRARRLSYS